MIESTRIVPVLAADIRAIRSSSNIEYDPKYTKTRSACLINSRIAVLLHETNHSYDLDDCEYEFGLPIPFDTKQVDQHDDE